MKKPYAYHLLFLEIRAFLSPMRLLASEAPFNGKGKALRAFFLFRILEGIPTIAIRGFALRGWGESKNIKKNRRLP